MSEKIIVGRFGRAHGIQGWIHVSSYTDPFDNLLNYDHWFMQNADQSQPIEIEAKKRHGDEIIVKIAKCDDREAAKAYTHKTIAIETDQLPQLKKGEYYWQQLIGLSVTSTEGVHLGKVDYLFETGANDVLVVKNEQEHLIPYTDNVVKSVDLDAQQMIVDWDPNCLS